MCIFFSIYTLLYNICMGSSFFTVEFSFRVIHNAYRTHAESFPFDCFFCSSCAPPPSMGLSAGDSLTLVRLDMCITCWS